MRKFYYAITKTQLRLHSNIQLAGSERAARALFGHRWQHLRNQKILHYGIDLSPFCSSVDRQEMRRELGIHPDAYVIGHVGRFIEAKNHLFLLEIARHLATVLPEVQLLLVGDGPLVQSVRERARELGIADRVVFAGVRSDVPRVMMGAMDLFVLPSLYEGLPLVGVEAQAASLPLFISERITAEVCVAADLVQRISISSSAERWADAIREYAQSPKKERPECGIQSIRDTDFDIIRNVTSLAKIYDEGRSYVH